jgi:hypothetical protein
MFLPQRTIYFTFRIILEDDATSLGGFVVNSAQSISRDTRLRVGNDERNYPSPSSLASSPRTALAQPFSFRSRVA